jgi:pimeloyl-ACP methyl ester carboxylesterase
MRAKRLGFLLFAVLVTALPCSAAPAEIGVLHDEFVDVNGVRLHYVVAGEGPLMIFLHGFPEFWYQWKPQLAEFSRDHRVVALDMRGYNLSAKPDGTEPYEIHHLVEDVSALAKKLGARKFVLVGHDWGGVVAWAFALYHPDELEKLVVINAPHPSVFDRELKENPAQQLASRYMIAVRDPAAVNNLVVNNYDPLSKLFLADGLRDGRLTDEDRDAYLKAWSQPGALESALNYYRAAHVGPPDPATHAAANGNYTPDLRSTVVKVPTLLIWGMQDRYILAGNLSGIGAYVPDLTVKLVPDASHWISHEKPGQVNGFIREFVGGEPAPKSAPAK